MVSMRVVVGSSALMSACALGKHEASALLQVTSSKHIQNAIQKLDTLKFKEDVSLLDMEEQLNEFKDHVASVLQDPSNVSPEDIKLLTDMISLLDTTFLAELTRQKETDVTRYNTKRSQHVKCTTDKDKRMHSTTGDVTKEESSVSAKRVKHKGCRKAQKSFETFRSDAEKVGLASFGTAVGVDSASVPEISTLCTKKDQWDIDKRLYKGLATVNHVALCTAEQKDFEDMTCTWLKTKASTCIAYDECIEDINLTNEKNVTEKECTNRMDVEVILAKTKCHLLHLSKVFNNENSTNLCDNVTVDNSLLACSLEAVPAVSPCSNDANIKTPTLPTPSCSPTSGWITTEYSNFNISYETVTSCKIEAPCNLPTAIGTHVNSDGCIDSGIPNLCDFYARHRDACSDYPDDNAPINCCACGGGSTRSCDAALDCSGHGTTTDTDATDGCTCECADGYTGADCAIPPPCDTDNHCSGHGTTSDLDSTDGCVCDCAYGYSTADCSVDSKPNRCEFQGVCPPVVNGSWTLNGAATWTKGTGSATKTCTQVCDAIGKKCTQESLDLQARVCSPTIVNDMNIFAGGTGTTACGSTGSKRTYAGTPFINKEDDCFYFNPANCGDMSSCNGNPANSNDGHNPFCACMD